MNSAANQTPKGNETMTNYFRTLTKEYAMADETVQACIPCPSMQDLIAAQYRRTAISDEITRAKESRW